MIYPSYVKEKTLAVFLSLLSGVFIAIMAVLNASLGKEIGILESSFVVHLVGTLAGILFLLFTLKNPLPQRNQVPKHLLLGGILGVFIVFISNTVIPRLGMVLTMGLFLIGNLIFAMVADHFGLFGLPVYKISWRRAWGLICAITGLILAF